MRLAALAAAAVALGSCSSPRTEKVALDAPSASTAACPQASPDSGDVKAVVAAAQAFSASLSPVQRNLLVTPFNLQNAVVWSNLPSYVVPRLGVAVGDMTPAQTAAANALILAAAGACGAELFAGNRAADVVGHKVIDYIGPDHYYLSFHGEPSPTRPWMLTVGGHHMAFNLVFNGKQPGATPLFAGSDPGVFTDETGARREPVARQRAAMTSLIQAAAQYPDAKLPGVYTDMIRSVVRLNAGQLSPRPGDGQAMESATEGYARAAIRRHAVLQGLGGMDTGFPQDYPTGSTGRGVSYAKLSPAEQAMVRRAIEAYAALPGRRTSDPLLAAYERPEALAQTYVAFSGDPNLVAPASYARIDGPRVWIEMSVQTSLYDAKATHSHSVWRDKVSDYGGEFRP